MFTFAARMGVSSPGTQDGRISGYDEKIGLIEKAIQSFQHWTERIDDRLTRIEADVFTNKSKIRENHDILQSFDTKLRVLEVREQRFDRVSNALERFLEDNGRNPELRTELSSGLQLGMMMSSPNVVGNANREHTSLLALPGVIRPRTNVDKLVASEKCRPVLDFPERIKSVSSSNSSAGSRAVSRETSVQRELPGDPTSQRPTYEDGTSDLVNDSANVNPTAAELQTNEKSVDVPIEDVNEDVSFPTSSGFSVCQKVDKNVEAVAETSKAKRTTKRKRISSRTKTASDADKSNLPGQKILVASNNFKPGPEQMGYVPEGDMIDATFCKSSSSSASSETMNQDTDAVHEISKATRTTKRKRIACSIETEPAQGKRSLPNMNSTKASTNSKPNHEKLGFRCQICDKIFESRLAYMNDQRFHILGPIKCHLCTFETTYKASLGRHFKGSHPGCRPTKIPHAEIELPVPEGKPFVCDFPGCDKSYRRKNNLVLHLKSHPHEALKCTTTETGTSSVADTANLNFPRNDESLKAPDSNKESTNKMGYKCLTCGKVFSLAHKYKDHQRFHIIGKVKCHLCSTEITSMTSLRGHFKRAHPGSTPTQLPFVETPILDLNDRPFACHVTGCTKTYRSKFRLQEHLLCHGGEKYKCALCDFETVWKSNLTKHSQRFHQEAHSENESGSSISDALMNFPELTPTKQNSNRTTPRKKTQRKVSKVPVKIKLPFTPSKPSKPSLNESFETEDEDTSSKPPTTASPPKLISSASASKKRKISPKISRKKKLKSSPNGFQSSLNNKHKMEEKKSDQLEASELEAQSSSTPSYPMDVSPGTPENYYDEDTSSATPTYTSRPSLKNSAIMRKKKKKNSTSKRNSSPNELQASHNNKHSISGNQNESKQLQASEQEPQTPSTQSFPMDVGPFAPDNYDDEDEVNSTNPTYSSSPNLNISATESKKKKKKSSQKSSKQQLKSTPDELLQLSQESAESEASKPEPQIPSTSSFPINESPCAPENNEGFHDDADQSHVCPLCSRSFSKISKLDRHFQKKH